MVRLPPPVRPLFPYLKPIYTAWTGAIAPFAMALGKRSGRLPSGFVSDLPDAAISTGGRWVIARPGEVIDHRPVPDTTAGHVDSTHLFEAAAREFVPPVYAAELPHARVLSRHHAVLSGNGDLVHGPSQYFGTTQPQQHPLFLRPFARAPHRVSGRLGVIATRGDANYFHFLIDALPRIGLLTDSGLEPPKRWYCPADEAFQRELLQMMRIDLGAIVDSSQFPHVEADELVLANPPSLRELNPPWVVDFLRSHLMPSGLTRIPNGGVYLTRGHSANNRTVVNEGEVVAALAQRGVRCIDTSAMTVSEQIREAAQASVIVSAHGAALTNIVFANAGCTVIELFPTGPPVPDFWKLACAVPGVAYHYLCAAGPRPVRSREQLLVSDIRVDVPALVAIVDDALAKGATDRAHRRHDAEGRDRRGLHQIATTARTARTAAGQ